jgi:hypothetical protein
VSPLEAVEYIASRAPIFQGECNIIREALTPRAPEPEPIPPEHEPE